MKQHGRAEEIVTDKLRSYGAALESWALKKSRSPEAAEQPGRELAQPSEGEKGDAAVQATAQLTES
jgi:transposase-like protein